MPISFNVNLISNVWINFVFYHFKISYYLFVLFSIPHPFWSSTILAKWILLCINNQWSCDFHFIFCPNDIHPSIPFSFSINWSIYSKKLVNSWFLKINKRCIYRFCNFKNKNYHFPKLNIQHFLFPSIVAIWIDDHLFKWGFYLYKSFQHDKINTKACITKM